MIGRCLQGRRIIVSGASQGLGYQIASCLLAAGADIVMGARTAADIETAAANLASEFPERRVLALPCDVSMTVDVDRLFEHAIATFGEIDAVINNAGIHGPIGTIDEIDWQAWQQAIAVNLIGTVYSCRRAVQHFRSRTRSDHRGKIVNLSGGGATAPQPGLSAYGASKAGLVRFTETLAEEMRSHAIDVNAVAPGALATRLMIELREAGPDRIGAKYHARVEELYAKGGMSIARAADLCVYLVSPLSDGITGRLISAAWDPWPFSPEVAKDLMSSDIFTLRRIGPEERGRKWGVPA